MSENGVRRVIVCDGTNLVGVVSVGDLAVQVSDALAGEVMSETGPDDRGKNQHNGNGRNGGGSVGIAERDLRRG